ncbi:MAG TPA: lysylphosphatidylglycerol synthase transmembrane domain-containing protein [Haloplasmataceae bacterium]
MREFLKKYRKNLLIVVIIGFIVYFYILFKNDAKLIIEKISQVNIIYVPIILFLLFVYLFFEAQVIFILARKRVKGLKIGDAFRVNLATQFFNAVTPFASGGQPFQVVYLNSRGIKVRDATSIVLINFITFNIAFLILGIFSLIFKFNYFNYYLAQEGYQYILIIGFIVNFFVTVFSIFLTYSRKFYYFFIEVLLKKIARWPLIRKFKLETKTENMKKAIDDFNIAVKTFNYKGLWLISIFYHLIRIICFYAIPLVIFMALGENVSGNEFNIIVGAFFVAMVMSYIPTPGASGGAEGLFYIIFSIFFKNSIIAALLLWRFITYYISLLIGFISLITLNHKKNLVYFDSLEEEMVENER